MPRKGRRRSFEVLVPSLAIAALALGCRHRTASPGPLVTTHCKEAPPNPAPKMIPLTQSVESLHNAHNSAYRGCTTEIAELQPVAAGNGNDEPQTVPADASCSYGDAK